MSAVEAPKVADVPAAGHVEPAPAPIEPVHIDHYVNTAEAPVVPENKTEGEVAAPLEEKTEVQPEAKAVEPIHSGALGYKAPGLKNAFRFAKKYFWFGEEPVHEANLREYLRGEKPEVAHPVVAWSSQTGKGLMYFVKHADQKEHPAGVLNLAYATDLVKDGGLAFSLKISGHKHTFEAQNAAERDGWFVAVEKAITEAKASKDGIESSEGYKEHKEKIGKPTALAAATASSAPKKSLDATPALATTDTSATEEPVVAAPAAARVGSSSSSSSDEAKKAKKSKSRSASRGNKRTSIFGGLLGKKDKPEEKTDAKKLEHKEGSDAVVTADEPEIKKDDAPAVASITDVAPVIETPATQPISTGEDIKTDATPAPVVVPVVEGASADAVPEKPKTTKRTSMFGNFMNKLQSPTTEKKEAEAFPPAVPVKDEAPAMPLEEAKVEVPATLEPVTTAPKEDVTVDNKVSTPTKEKEHFKFGKLFSGAGGKDRSKSPAAAEKTIHEPTKVDAVAPQLPSTEAEPAQPIVAAPVAAVESQPEPVVADAKKEKRSSIFQKLGRSLSQAAGSGKKDAPKEKKEAVSTVPEVAEEDKTAAPVLGEPTPATEPVVVGSANVDEAPKSNPTVGPTA